MSKNKGRVKAVLGSSRLEKGGREINTSLRSKFLHTSGEFYLTGEIGGTAVRYAAKE